MPFSPDYSDYLRMKRIQKTIDVDSRIEARKTRSTYAYGAYNPSYKIGYLPPNLFTPGRLVPQPPPAPPSGDFVTIGQVIVRATTTLYIEAGLVVSKDETKINWGDDKVDPIISNTPLSHRYAPGTYTIKLSNPTNILAIDISQTDILSSLTLTDLTALSILDASSNLSLGLVEFSSTLDRLNISTTAITSLSIPDGSILTNINATDCSRLVDILGTIPSTLRTLSIQGTAIDTCAVLERLAGRLPHLSAPDEGTVYYTEPQGGCSLSRQGWRFVSEPYFTFGTIKIKGGEIISITSMFSNGTTKIDFGDGSSPQVVTSGSSVTHQYGAQVAGPFILKVTNPSNIREITLNTSSNLDIDLSVFSSLSYFDCTDCAGLNTLGTLPSSLSTLYAGNTTVLGSITIPSVNALTYINLTSSGIQSIVNFENARSLERLFIQNCKGITVSLSLPDTLIQLAADRSGLSQIMIPSNSVLESLSISGAPVSSILGIGYASHLTYLDMPNVQITDAGDLQNIFNALPSGGGYVVYTENTNFDPTTCGGTSSYNIECGAIINGWSFRYV